MTGNKITIIRGNGRVLVAIAVDIDGRIMDLRGADKVQLAVREEEDSEDAVIFKEGYIDIPKLGVVNFLVLPSETNIEPKNYWYDIKVWFSGGVLPYTIVKDRFEVVESINKEFEWIS